MYYKVFWQHPFEEVCLVFFYTFPDANHAPCRMFQAGETPTNILARMMMSCAPCGPAARAGRVRREIERFTVMEKLHEERQPCWSGNKNMTGSSLPGIQCRDVDLVFLENNKINYKKKSAFVTQLFIKIYFKTRSNLIDQLVCSSSLA